ncbi:methyltransferase [Thalassotalea sp. LPB0316]|uniref:methyltransferase n=1 Tax=Thalassotalea sp. LPB0316 TaxID=2769490 RepID=UPI00186743BF|nr:methyltransferase [Thalassotalea sp. LPB0316]QOL26994.1 methyltransferase [Thalassotalea sp. LPB0316]
MQSPFIVNEQALSLYRYPISQNNRSLQAWDAADEYLINYLTENDLLNKDSKVLVVNDSFGALSINLLNYSTTMVSDSWLAHRGLEENIAQNHLSADNLTISDSLTNLPNDANVVLYKIPKSKALLAEQLIQIKRQLSSDIIFIAAARAKDIHSSTLKVFEKYLGTTTTSLAVKKARLVFCQLDNQQTHQSPFPTVWPLEGTPYNISNHANVFAREKLDLGARFFIPHLPNIKPNQQVIDLGCGNGVIGLTLLNTQPAAQLTFVDESFMAVASAKQNIENNLPDAAEHCQFVVNDCLSGFEANSVDVVVCNPPFHQQQATTDHIAWQMFNDAHRVLKHGGELRIIGNRNLAYHIKLKRIFGGCKTIASDKKFVVLSARK